VEAQRGFSLIELLVAAAIAFVIGWQLLALTHTTILGADRLDARLRAQGAVDRLEERLAGDAATAWSVFVPPRALDGTNNSDGHEIDFVTEDAAHRSFWWAYSYDAAAARVTNYAYVPGGARVAGETYEGVTVFAAGVHPISDLRRPQSEAYDPLFANATVTPVAVPFGWNPQAVGGNHLVIVPSRFTIVVDYTPAPVTPTP
jgi:type II secretory pathway pseudopilin PulG